MVNLPSSFVNSARYLHEYTQDAFTYVRNYGRPDLFITMTCNPAWPEITRELIPGRDQAIFNIRQQGNVNIDPRDEVQTFRAGRYVSSNEAAWRILGLPLHERHPTVIHLAFHLPNGEGIYFTEKTFRERMATPPKTALTAFFQLCQNDAFAKTLLSVDVPRCYTWNVSLKE
ncbi:ATP-dependent DNA helicase [Trichonephila clavipes]|nr:ATP-dependent DNA helicase [Trichonephila clavipes]